MTRRLPALQQILSVLALVAVPFYGWTIMVFFWKLPGWLYFLSVGEIATLLAFALATNLIESLLIAASLVLAAALLPSRLLRDSFVVRGGAFALALIGAMILIDILGATNRLVSPLPWTLWILAALLIGFLLAWFASRVTAVGRGLAWLADQLTIFLFLLIPLSVVSILILLARGFLI